MTETLNRRIAAVAGLIITVGATSACDLIEPADSAPVKGYVVDYVIDGDTIDVTDPDGNTQRVRLLGINTPEAPRGDEPGQCGGQEATQQLAELLPEGTAVQLTTDAHADDEDRYGRLLRYVETDDGTDVGMTLINEGHAHAWTPTSAPEPQRTPDYELATQTARDNKAGSWAICPTLDESR